MYVVNFKLIKHQNISPRQLTKQSQEKPSPLEIHMFYSITGRAVYVCAWQGCDKHEEFSFKNECSIIIYLY